MGASPTSTVVIAGKGSDDKWEDDEDRPTTKGRKTKKN